MDAFGSILMLIGTAYAVYRGVKWLLRSGQLSARRERQLTPNDLKALEESASQLMADLKGAADECVTRIEKACDEAERRIACFSGMAGVSARPTEAAIADSPATTSPSSIDTLLEVDLPAADIARQAGLTTGEVELMQSLRAVGRNV